MISNLLPKVYYLGRRPYYDIWKSMEQFTHQRKSETQDEIWMLEHETIYTLGKSGTLGDIIKPNTIPVVYADRGGKISYHAPGQLIVYLLLNLRRLKCGIRQLIDGLEGTVIALLADYNIVAYSNKSAPGVYVDNAKIASLGLRIRHGYCYHGLALNVDMDLKPFSYIRPCGFDYLKITQIADWVETVNIGCVCSQFLHHWEQQPFYNMH